MPEHQHHVQPDEVMDPELFLSHAVRVHTKRQRLNDVFAGKAHWVFAMTQECRDLAMRRRLAAGGREARRLRRVRPVRRSHVGPRPDVLRRPPQTSTNGSRAPSTDC